jgi:hypothetical protein
MVGTRSRAIRRRMSAGPAGPAGPAEPAEPAEPAGRDALPRDPAPHVQERYKEIRFGAAPLQSISSRAFSARPLLNRFPGFCFASPHALAQIPNFGIVLVVVLVLDQSAFSAAKRARLPRNHFVQFV